MLFLSFHIIQVVCSINYSFGIISFSLVFIHFNKLHKKNIQIRVKDYFLRKQKSIYLHYFRKEKKKTINFKLCQNNLP
jgi:hypothetical protein